MDRMKTGSTEVFTVPYIDGSDKKITVWLPPGYTQGVKAYGVLYMTDGQTLFDANAPYGGWRADLAVLQRLEQGKRGMIVVGIDNANEKRESELTPDLGQVPPMVKAICGFDFSKRTGRQFSCFVTQRLMPLIEEKYSVLSDREHTMIAGSSSGGLEAFYIGLENREKFSCIAAFSPAFVLFDEKTWASYLRKFNFADMHTRQKIYIYNGNADILEKILYAPAIRMVKRLQSYGFLQAHIRFEENKRAGHNEQAWRKYLPRALDWLQTETNTDKENAL